METMTTIAFHEPEFDEHADYWRVTYPALEEAKERVWTQYQDVVGELGREMKLRVVLTYEEPVRLYHAGRTRYETAKAHEVKRLFASDGKVYYIPTACRTRGYRLSWHGLLEIRVLAEQKDYSAEWARIARSMRQHNLNLDLAKEIEEHLAGKRDSFYYRTYQSRPTKMSFEDVTRGRTLEEMWEEAATSNGRRYFYARVRGKRRDRSVSLTKTRDGWWRFTGASEHAGTGNGDYYIFYSLSMAFFGESD